MVFRAVRIAAASLLVGAAVGLPTYPALLPNGAAVPGCTALGHTDCIPGGPRNQFGLDWAANGRTWNPTFCALDSDGDGVTNGEELGDPCCQWTPDNTSPPGFRTTQISHPGDATKSDAKDAPKCPGNNGGSDATEAPATTVAASEAPVTTGAAAEAPAATEQATEAPATTAVGTDAPVTTAATGGAAGAGDADDGADASAEATDGDDGEADTPEPTAEDNDAADATQEPEDDAEDAAEEDGAAGASEDPEEGAAPSEEIPQQTGGKKPRCPFEASKPPAPESNGKDKQPTNDFGCGSKCEFTFCDKSGQESSSTVDITGASDIALTKAICKKDKTYHVGIVNTAEAYVEGKEGEKTLLSAWAPHGLAQQFSAYFFKAYNLGKDRYSGVGHEVPQQNQGDFLDGKCFILPIKAYQVLDKSKNVVDNRETKDPFTACVSFTTKTQ